MGALWIQIYSLAQNAFPSPFSNLFLISQSLSMHSLTPWASSLFLWSPLLPATQLLADWLAFWDPNSRKYAFSFSTSHLLPLRSYWDSQTPCLFFSQTPQKLFLSLLLIVLKLTYEQTMKPEENTILSADTQAVLTDSATDSSPTGQLESQPLGRGPGRIYWM